MSVRFWGSAWQSLETFWRGPSHVSSTQRLTQMQTVERWVNISKALATKPQAPIKRKTTYEMSTCKSREALFPQLCGTCHALSATAALPKIPAQPKPAKSSCVKNRS